MLNRVKQELAHVGVVERDAMFEGRLMTMFMAPVAPSKSKSGKPKNEEAEQEEQVKEESDAEA